MARVALDAMGGDHAPAETVAGAVAAAAVGHDVVLVGDEAQLRAELSTLGADLRIIHASQTIDMGDDPARAIREKSDASVVVAARLVRDGEAQALVSAGSTGAALAASAILIGRLPGVHRPAIATIFPTGSSATVVLDCGANPVCRPEHLAQFAVMGSSIAEIYLDVSEPRIGLLNIGEEPGKGRDLEKEAFGLLEAMPIRFIGNVEGRDLAADKADVFVTDGYTGNVMLKTSEGTAQFVSRVIAAAVAEGGDAPPAMLTRLAEVHRRLDYETSGGAHLVGTNGVVVIAHGSSSRRAIENAVAMAADGAGRGLVDKIAAGLAPVP